MSNQLQMGGSIDDPIILSDDDFHQLLETVISSGTIPNFDVSLSGVDWEEFDRMIGVIRWDEISDDDMKVIIDWCNQVERQEHQRLLHEYVDNINDIDMEEVFGPW